MNEKLEYNISFLWVMKAATGSVSFKKGAGKGYIGKYEAKAGGLVSASTCLFFANFAPTLGPLRLKINHRKTQRMKRCRRFT